MKQINESFFKAIVLAFSAVILVFSLLTTIDVAAEKEQRSRLTRELRDMEEENELLRARAEQCLSLEEIERYARDVLGMQTCGVGQIVYLEYPEN